MTENTEKTKTEAQVQKDAEQSAKPAAPKTASKSQAIIEAAEARARARAEKGEDQVNDTTRRYATEIEDADLEAAQKEADTRVQAAAQSMTGKVDVEAMGDVKGNGGDAKNYADGDPDKALGVPTYAYGLNDVKAGGAELNTAPGNVQSAKTKAEIDRGKKVLSDRSPRK